MRALDPNSSQRGFTGTAVAQYQDNYQENQPVDADGFKRPRDLGAAGRGAPRDGAEQSHQPDASISSMASAGSKASKRSYGRGASSQRAKGAGGTRWGEELNSPDNSLRQNLPNDEIVARGNLPPREEMNDIDDAGRFADCENTPENDDEGRTALEQS